MKTPSFLIGSGLLSFTALAAIYVGACGGEPPPPAAPVATVTAEAPPPPPPPAAPTAEPTAAASAAVEPPKRTSGGPMIVKSDPNEVTDTFGSIPASKITVGEAVLRIPERALHGATNITFKVDKGKGTAGQVGKVYRLIPTLPPAPEAVSVESSGPPFELQLPAGNKKDANLAIGTDDKGKIKWTIIAPKRIDDALGMAIFELTTLPAAAFHVTTKPPTK